MIYKNLCHVIQVCTALSSGVFYLIVHHEISLMILIDTLYSCPGMCYELHHDEKLPTQIVLFISDDFSWLGF